MDIQALIAAHRAEVESAPSKDVPIPFGGESVTVTVTELRGDAWQDLTAEHPPRAGNTDDEQLGFNPKTLTEAFPGVRVNGELVDAGTWAEMYSLMDAVSRNAIAGTIWQVHVMDKLSKFAALGKASAARQSVSPANRASRRAASKGGSQPKSRGTSTTKKDD